MTSWMFSRYTRRDMFIALLFCVNDLEFDFVKACINFIDID